MKDYDGEHKLNDCEYLFVTSVREIEELTLEILVSEAKAQAPILVAKNDSEVERLKVGSRPVHPDSTCRTFCLVFDANKMVSYTVLNESYSRYPESQEVFTGKKFRVFANSNLLDFARSHTNASDQYPGPLFHYELICENHIVDVIATGPPSITSFSSESVRALIALGGSDPDAQVPPRRRYFPAD